jgi:hypothetical protein
VQRTLQQHIDGLQARLETLHAGQMSRDKSQAECNAMEAEIRAIKMALAHYKSALEIEISIGTTGNHNPYGDRK